MRSIKFRAWDVNGQFDPEERPGMLDDVGITSHTSDWDGEPSWMSLRGQVYINPAHKDFHLMQFTGLLDKNGREIYEGDIVVEAALSTRIGVVEYDNGSFISRSGEQELLWSRFIPSQLDTLKDVRIHFLEVIGNIYQNGELLITD